MIVMPGAWRCERHRLWTNGDCPDCDADLIASHEGQDEDMTAPLTTRDALAEALRTAPDPGGWRAGMDGDDYADLADALLASGALTDATKLAEDEALVDRVARLDHRLHHGDGARMFDDDWLTTTEQVLIALAAALSAQ